MSRTDKSAFNNANFVKLCATKLFRFQWPREKVRKKSFLRAAIIHRGFETNSSFHVE